MKKILLTALLASTFTAQNASALNLKSALSFSRDYARSSDRWASQAVIRTDRYVVVSQSNSPQGALQLESFDRNKIAAEHTTHMGSLQLEPHSQLRVVTITAFSRAHQSKIELCIPKGSIDLHLMSGMPERVKRKYVSGKPAIIFDVDQPPGGDYAFFSASSVEVADGSDQTVEQACAKAVDKKLSLR
jgi:hypothetical protein